MRRLIRGSTFGHTHGRKVRDRTVLVEEPRVARSVLVHVGKNIRQLVAIQGFLFQQFRSQLIQDVAVSVQNPVGFGMRVIE